MNDHASRYRRDLLHRVYALIDWATSTFIYSSIRRDFWEFQESDPEVNVSVEMYTLS
jgi:hypothetical protein